MKICLSSQKGFAHLFLLLALILIILGLVIFSKLQVVKTYPLKETGNVQGALIAKGDDDSGGSSGSGSSGSNGSNSGNSGNSIRSISSATGKDI